jgi:hypothetical protein
MWHHAGVLAVMNAYVFGIRTTVSYSNLKNVQLLKYQNVDFGNMAVFLITCILETEVCIQLILIFLLTVPSNHCLHSTAS